MKPVISIRQFLFIYILLFQIHSVDAQIEVHSFKALPMDQTARITDPVIDQNGEKCALIKVVTKETGFGWEGGMLGIIKVIPQKGEYWVYIPHGAKKITIKHEKHGVLRNYFYTEPILEARVYELVLKTSIIIPDGKGDLNLLSNPANATIKIDGFPAFNDKTPYEFRDYLTGPYRMIISRNRYEPVDTTLVIYKDSLVEHSIRLKPRFGGLSLIVNPDDAYVYLENELIGIGYITLKGETNGPDAGKYSLEIKKEKYHPFFEIIEISAGETTKLDIELEARLGSLSVKTAPADAELILDGISMGFSPLNIVGVIVGEHQLEIRKQGYQTISKTIIIAEGETFENEYILNSKKIVNIRTKPANAEITINGKTFDGSPVHTELPLGENNIIIKSDHYKTLENIFTVDEKQDKYYFTLELVKQRLKVITKPAKAEVTVNGDSIGFSPATASLSKGKYKIKVKKSGYIPEERTVYMRYDDKTKKIRLRNEGMINLGYLNGPFWDGFDVGIIYRRVLIGFNFNVVSKHDPGISLTAGNVSSSDIPGISFSNPSDCYIHTVKDGESESAGFTAKGELGYRILRPVQMIFTIGYGRGKINSIEYVYQADKDYYNLSEELVLEKGDYYSEHAKEKEFSSFIVGLKLPIATSTGYGIYLNANYWFNTPFERKYTIGGGIVFSSQ